MPEVNDSLPMKPLQASWEANQLEKDMKALFIKLYDDHLRATADEINVYGAPHLGSFRLVERSVTSEGLTLVRQGDESGMRYLFKAWKYRNPQRGLHFIRLYLQILWPGAHDVQQMWQKKSGTYPDTLKSLSEIIAAAESEGDYFLTSRLRVYLDTDIVPDRILRALATSVAARFVLSVAISKFMLREVGIASAASAMVLAYTTIDGA